MFLISANRLQLVMDVLLSDRCRNLVGLVRTVSSSNATKTASASAAACKFDFSTF